jgi:hypothetical protein
VRRQVSLKPKDILGNPTDGGWLLDSIDITEVTDLFSCPVACRRLEMPLDCHVAACD